MKLFGGAFLISLIGLARPASGQVNDAAHKIQQDFKDQKISRETKVLYQLYAGIKPERLPTTYQSSARQTPPIKCATPFVMEYYQQPQAFSSSARRAINRVIGPPALKAGQTFNSASGRFIITYSTSGEDAVPVVDANANGVPDYVETAAAAADSSWRYEVQSLGFQNPVTGSVNPYPIFIENLGAAGAFGFTSTGGNRGYPNATYMVINSQLDRSTFQHNDDPNPEKGAIKVTVAHEFKHAIQFANSRWYDLPGSSNGPHSLDWTEMDATLMEELVFDPVNDYYNYISGPGSIFLSDDHHVPEAYAGVTWMIYFADRFQPTFWVKVWQDIHRRYLNQRNVPNPNYLTMPGAISKTLEGSYNSTFASAFALSQLWHETSGPVNNTPNFGFSERDNYPDPLINRKPAGRDTTRASQIIPPLAADYIQLDASVSVPGTMVFKLDSTEAGTNLGLLAYFNDGHTDYQIYASRSGQLKADTHWQWKNVARVAIVVANGSTALSTDYLLQVSSDIPDKVTIKPNYPNPFSRQTTIPISLPKNAHLKVTLFDITGRRVRTLVDENRTAGTQNIHFDASGLASGIYLVQIIVGDEVTIQKITLIK